jgi:ABC-2 type transport system ATP-binding protein
MSAIVDVKNLTKRFGTFTAVHNISFSIKEGEIVGLLGPNGAGKTTTIAMMLGIITPTSGSIAVFGLPFAENRESILKLMNYSSAYTRAPWRLKVWEHLYVFALMYEIPDAKKKIAEVLQIFHLTKQKDVLTGDLSSGNMARLNLCKAFINQPRVVLLDEPTSSLDPDVADQVRQFIKLSRSSYKTTILITSHNMAEIEELCDRVIFMNHGKIIAEDTPEGLSKKIKKTRVRFMMKDGTKRTKKFAEEAGFTVEEKDRYLVVELDEEDVAYLLAGLAGQGVSYDQISIDKPTLNDYFIGEAREKN